MLSVLFVDDDATSGGNGLAWGTAYNDLQDALSRAETLNGDAYAANNVDQIWIAEGTYLPSAELEPGDPRSASFSLVDGVALYGGFLGTETAIEERGDVSVHVTELSGDLGVTGDLYDNAYTVVYCGENTEASINALLIVGGYADGDDSSNHLEECCGGGVFNSGTLTVTNSIVWGNTAFRDLRDGFRPVFFGGGGIYNNYSGTLTVTDSTISGNLAATGSSALGARGGGIYNDLGTLTVMNTEFAWNSAWEGASGGGIYNSGTAILANNTFWMNSADYGGGLSNDFCYVLFKNSTDKATEAYNDSAAVTLTNCEFWLNQACEGGAISATAGTVTVTNSTLTCNSADYGGGICIDSGTSTVALNNSIVAQNNRPYSSEHNDVFHYSGSLTGSHNLIGDGTGQTTLSNGTGGNLVGTSANPLDPLFVRAPSDGGDGWGDNPYTIDVDESANDDSGDLRPRSDSPAVDAGANALAVGPSGGSLEFDIDGSPRILDGDNDGTATVDMGAEEYVPVSSHTPQWTVMVYMNGDCDLEDAMLEDFLEMAAVGSSDEVNIVVQMDRTPGHDDSYGNWTNIRRGRVESGDIPDTSWGTSIVEANMGAASILRCFATWAANTYPAENYAIILWDHGNGFAGVCADESAEDDELDIPELTAAFGAMSSDLRVVAFDACLMGMTELGYQFAPFADVFVGSEETLPNDGYNYAFLRSVVNNPEISATGLASAIVNSLMSQPGYSSDDVTIAASRAAAIRSGVLSSINQLTSAILGNSDFDWDQFWADAANAQQFDEADDVPFRDLADFMSKIAGGGYGSAVTGAANAVRNAVHAAVFAEDGTMPSAEGLSIYLPVDGDDVLPYFELYNDDHLDFVADGLWDELIAEGRMHQFAEGKGLYEAWSGFGYNHRGRQEKYFADKNGNWYAVVPNGAVYSAPFEFDDAQIVTTLSEDYWADPNRMFLPDEQAPVVTDPLEFAEGRGLYEAWNGFGVNHRGRNEKYFADSEGNWYAILPDGNIYSTPWVFDQSTLVASLDSMYWQDPNKLFGVGAPDTLAAYQFAHQRDLSEQWVGWGINHRGHNEKYFYSSAESQWYAILPNGEIHHSRAGWVFNSGSVVATTSADYWQDPNRLIYAANPNGLKAYQFANGLGLYQRWSNWRLNERGRDEKYFSDKNGAVYAILPNGQVHREASVFGSSSFYTALSSDYYRDPTLLFVYQ